MEVTRVASLGIGIASLEYIAIRIAYPHCYTNITTWRADLCASMYTHNVFNDVKFMLLIHVNPYVLKKKSILTDFYLHSEHRTG